jgi:2-keto-4-pentenoate hydratase/2-oxohepta-3-ene-1,7-dioic acid hydratase in catechol pathway
MTLSIYRTVDAWWAGTTDTGAKVDTNATTTAQLLADWPALDRAAASSETVPVSSLKLLSPITAPCRVVAQMTNFAPHVKDTGGDPKKVPLTFSRKAWVDRRACRQHRQAHPCPPLDYEVAIGLMIGRDMPVGAAISPTT